MNALVTAEVLIIGVEITEPELAARLATLLGAVPGLRLAQGEEACDLVLREPDVGDGGFVPALTPRAAPCYVPPPLVPQTNRASVFILLWTPRR